MSIAVTVVLIALVVACAVVPRLTGGTSLTVLTGSMEPTFAPGDVIVVRGVDPADVCTDVAVGDIVSYLPNPDDPTLITHWWARPSAASRTGRRAVWSRRVTRTLLVGYGVYASVRRLRARELRLRERELAVARRQAGLLPETPDLDQLVATLLALLLLIAVVARSAAGQAPLTGARSRSSGASSVDPVAGSEASALTAEAAAGAQPGAVVPVDAIAAEWDGPTVHLDWAGRQYATAEASFIGDRVASPGDRVQRTLRLGNAGPSRAVLTVTPAARRADPRRGGEPGPGR